MKEPEKQWMKLSYLAVPANTEDITGAVSVQFDEFLKSMATKNTVFIFNVEKPVDEVRAAGEVLGHVVEPVCVDLCDQPCFPLDLQWHPE